MTADNARSQFERTSTTQIITELVKRGFDIAVTADGIQIYDANGNHLIG